MNCSFAASLWLLIGAGSLDPGSGAEDVVIPMAFFGFRCSTVSDLGFLLLPLDDFCAAIFFDLTGTAARERRARGDTSAEYCAMALLAAHMTQGDAV
jgi:hypothetical protein